MNSLQQQFAAMSDSDLERFCDILDSIEQKLKIGMSYSSEIQALGYEFSFSDANLLDTDSMLLLANREGRNRWQKQRKENR